MTLQIMYKLLFTVWKIPILTNTFINVKLDYDFSEIQNPSLLRFRDFGLKKEFTKSDILGAINFCLCILLQFLKATFLNLKVTNSINFSKELVKELCAKKIKVSNY